MNDTTNNKNQQLNEIKFSIDQQGQIGAEGEIDHDKRDLTSINNVMSPIEGAEGSGLDPHKLFISTGGEKADGAWHNMMAGIDSRLFKVKSSYVYDQEEVKEESGIGYEELEREIGKLKSFMQYESEEEVVLISKK